MALVRWFVWLIYILVALGLTAFGLYFGFENATAVSPKILGYSLPEINLGFWLVAFLILGLLIGMLLGLVNMFATRTRIRSLSNQLDKAQQELRLVRQQRLGDS
ncbi:lipopolysaccharide assembly protein LapA domain-containing protein [Biformimicrobium ophioploci]|uniref:Lipopolysaccharide assembly protein A domain-containing protein n=1 Tax=Biformimicrobium ophioploci TaxID=3036711 RepID=A0ABQ6M298_9GAMM|nr:lipopolysaccharide assembly protein LapA domain-containing protein [Microbulbifer sp. NKW57]GMG88457.1 hypothetical protein MNKW57_27780 [Microbulbifer sp. NKW57]